MRTLICLSLFLAVAGCSAIPTMMIAQTPSVEIQDKPSLELSAPQSPSGGEENQVVGGELVFPTKCPPPPILIPTAAPNPGYTQLDPTTGLHMTGRPVEIDLASYRLVVSGKVERTLQLSYDELRCMPKKEVKPTLICPGNFEDVTTWTGVPLAYVLDLAGVQSGANSLTLTGADEYSSWVSLKDALYQDNLIAYEWKGQPLPILHGFPVRAVFPAIIGGHWVKWLVQIEVE